MLLAAAHRDALKELFNIGTGRAAAELNALLGRPILLRVPELQTYTTDEVASQWECHDEDTIASIRMPFFGPFSGDALLAFPTSSASQLVGELTGEPSSTEPIDALRSGTLTEIGNILLNSVMGSIANALQVEFQYRVPIYLEDAPGRVWKRDSTAQGMVVVAKSMLMVESLAIEGHIHVVLTATALGNLIESLTKEGAAA